MFVVRSWSNAMLILIGAVFISALVFAYSYPCDNTAPGCYPCTVNDPCGPGGIVTECEPFEGWRFHCNVKDGDCPLDAGKCNVMMRTEITGFIMSCSNGTSGFCGSGKGLSVSTNIKCGEDTPCNPNETIIPSPDGIPDFPGDTGDDDFTIGTLEVPGT